MTFAPASEHAGISMTLIGQWQDLAAYYAGSDGNAWAFSACTYRWCNEGPLAAFRETFPTRRRGLLFPTPAERAALELLAACQAPPQDPPPRALERLRAKVANLKPRGDK